MSGPGGPPSRGRPPHPHPQRTHTHTTNTHTRTHARTQCSHARNRSLVRADQCPLGSLPRPPPVNRPGLGRPEDSGAGLHHPCHRGNQHPNLFRFHCAMPPFPSPHPCGSPASPPLRLASPTYCQPPSPTSTSTTARRACHVCSQGSSWARFARPLRTGPAEAPRPPRAIKPRRIFENSTDKCYRLVYCTTCIVDSG